MNIEEIKKFSKEVGSRFYFDHDFKRINYGGGFLQYNLSGRADILEFTFRRGFIREFYSSYFIPYLSIT